MFMPFALRGLGGGDVKLIAALGAWLGPVNALWLGLYAGVAGVVMALVVAVCADISGQRYPTSGFCCSTGGERHPPARRHFSRRQQRTASRLRVADFRRAGDGDMAALNALLKRFDAARAGAGVIEFGLTLPLLLLLVLGMIEFGFMFQEYKVVTNAAREGARIAVLPTVARPTQARTDHTNTRAP